MSPRGRLEQLVVSSAHDKEENRQNDESHELDGLPADFVDEEEGRPV